MKPISGDRDSTAVRVAVRRLVAILGRAEDVYAGFLLLVICTATAAQVVCRFILQAPLAWSDELSTYAFIWFTLLGAAIGVREGAHLGVDALTRILPERFKFMLTGVVFLLVQIFLVCLIILGIELVIRIGDQRSSALQLLIAWVYLSLPVSAALMLLHTLPQCLRLAQELRVTARRMKG